MFQVIVGLRKASRCPSRTRSRRCGCCSRPPQPSPRPSASSANAALLGANTVLLAPGRVKADHRLGGPSCVLPCRCLAINRLCSACVKAVRPARCAVARMERQHGQRAQLIWHQLAAVFSTLHRSDTSYRFKQMRFM